ncbi:uncharacterized protein [Cherax quadricarinatus]|nr:uncharacterized protein LOC128695463 [Cherax quadricarinatus]XP_053642087.1 uncharacterized protein LOC128695463 [Cherax quadricarinatus]
MADLNSLLESIKTGQVVGLQSDIQRFLEIPHNANGEGQQIIRYCSRYVYENQDLEQQTFSAILDIIDIACKYQHTQIASDTTFHVKSMFYIILISTKRKDLHHYLAGLITSLEPFLNKCDTSNGDALSIVKSLYQSVWNASLVATSPVEALTLQRFALQYLIASGSSVSKVCGQALKAHLSYEQVHKSSEHLDTFYQCIISKLTETAKIERKYDDDEVLAVFGLVMEYAKIVVKLNVCALFSKITCPFVTFCESFCDQQIILALKVGLKLTEVGMALKVGKCKEEMMVKLVTSFRVVPIVFVPNTIMLVSLLNTIALFEYQQDKDILYSLNSQVLSCLVEALLERCNTPLQEENVKKVATVLHQQLGCFVGMMKTSPDHKILTQALTWVIKTNTFMSTHCGKTSDAVWNIYNVGVNSGNLGVLAFRINKYDMAAKFLETSVDMLDRYHVLASEEQKIVVAPSLSKKVKLWSDALRYHENLWEAGVAAARGHIRGCLTLDDLLIVWIKCKRDAEKSGNKNLRGLTVCDVVNDAKRKYHEAEEFTFNNATALLSEIRCYKKQSYDTTEDVLSCGRALVECEDSAEMRVRGYLVIAEAVWICPNLASGDQEAIQCINKALSIVQEAMKSTISYYKLRELEALSYFWLYLCRLQRIQDTAAAETEESEKPISLTTQATDLGEEEQVDDTCDVRPSATCLTLHAQEVFFAPLHTALNIWNELSSQEVSLEDVEVTCSCLTSAGYVYQLSGLITPTVCSWATLVSIASKHSLHTYLIKGLSELLMIVPELVPIELVKEAEKAMVSCQAASQDSSLAYLCVSTTAAIAFYHYKLGQYDEGAKYLNQAMKSDVMEKRTLRATEVQALVHLVASLYAWLPHWVLRAPQQSSQPCISFAILACREAIALVGTTSLSINDVICWRHRLVWLHLTTAMWLGKLCLTSAQPRLARAYLKQSLGLAQRLALPLRTAELLELLAQVDLLCDQLEDCRVKVDSLQSLTVAHSSHQQSLETITPDFSKMTISHCTSEMKKTKQLYKKSVDSVLDDEERMRTGSGVSEYDLKSLTDNPALVVIGPEGRISQLINPQHPASPSMKYREEATIAHFEPCPRGIVDCVVCTTPTVQQLHISTAVLLALLHSHAGYHLAAEKCLNKAMAMYNVAVEKASQISSHLTFLIEKKPKGQMATSSDYVMSRLNMVHLRMLHAKADCLALEKKYQQAFSVNLQLLQDLCLQEPKLLYQDMHFISVVILQGHALQRAIEQTDTIECAGEVCEESQEEHEKCKNDWKTPLKAPPKALTNSCIKSARRELTIPGPSLAEEKGFIIYSDDDDISEELAIPLKITSPTPNKKLPAKPVKKQVRKFIVKTKTAGSTTKKMDDASEVASNFSKLNLDESPTKLVLKVPSAFPLTPNKNIPGSAKADNLFADISIPHIDKSQKKGKVVRRAKASSICKTINFSEKDTSSNDSSRGSDDIELCIDSKSKTVPKQARATRAARGVNHEKRNAESNSKPKKVAETRPSSRTRASRSLRLV